MVDTSSFGDAKSAFAFIADTSYATGDNATLWTLASGVLYRLLLSYALAAVLLAFFMSAWWIITLPCSTVRSLVAQAPHVEEYLFGKQEAAAPPLRERAKRE